jgi:hypothetical protein
VGCLTNVGTEGSAGDIRSFGSRSPVRLALAFRRALAIAAGLTLAAGCGSEDYGVVEPSSPPDIRAYVTAEAATNIDPTGHFILEGPQAPDDLPMIDAERARALAIAEMKTYHRFFLPQYEKEHGAPIDLKSLEVDPRILFVQTPYARVPDGYHPTLRQLFAPVYLVTFLQRGRPVITSAVSAYTTEAIIDSEGHVRLGMGGAEFFTRGIPHDTTQQAPPPRISAERAVELVGRRTGARITRTPELVRQFHPESPTDPLWRLELDRPVHVRRVQGMEHEAVHTLYVSGGRKLLIPARAQPTASHFDAIRLGPDNLPVGREIVEVPVRPGRITLFEEVTLSPLDAPGA